MSKLLAKMIMGSALMLLIPSLYAQNNMPVIAEFQGEHYRSGYGSSMTSLDFNHDGYDDLIIVSQSYDYVYGQSPSRGKVYIYYGGPGFNSSTPPSITLEGDNTTVAGKVITAVYNIGDVNGDGFDDLCLYDLSSMGNEEDRLRFYFGNASNLENPDYVIMIPISAHFHRVSKLGDFNGDGFDDVGIDIRYSAINNFSILWGGSFIEQIVSSGEGSPSYATSIIGIGDINNDGYDDFSLGFTNPDPNTGFHLVRIYYGNPAGDVSNPVVLIQTQDPITKVSKPLGDLNGDGYDDFMGYVSNNGMHAWLGGQNINYTIPDFNFVPEYYGGEYTLSVEFGDFNNDGFDDVVGASFYQRKFSVWLGKMNVNGTSDYIVSRLAYDNFGLGLTTGDFNADGFCDVAISAPFENSPMPSGTFTGYVWIHGGNAQLADTTVDSDDPELPGIDEQFDIRISPNPVNISMGVINV
ncbi:MAG: FG-GAP and VCBS repeat-containing protein, partial [Candidatus Cloacimonadaceae bacterium]|nr:FG-GAP and VCBS repeat-containing protein [Candidatus Cloacimonadaceae bacterium]